MGEALFAYPFVFASPEGTSRLRRGVRKLLGRETEPRVLREEGQDADDGNVGRKKTREMNGVTKMESGI